MGRIGKNVIWLLTFMWLWSACTSSQGNQNEGPQIDAYFDLAGLIEQQVENLSVSNPTIRKEAIIDGQQEVLEIDSMNWEKELGIFAKADINKPRLLSQYSTATYTDEEGNRVTQYRNVEDNVSGVIKMEIVETPGNQQLLSILVESCEYNTLFVSEVELKLTFEAGSDQANLTAYGIKGFEKVVLKDTMWYSIQTEIVAEI